jgi:hypothetical protein
MSAGARGRVTVCPFVRLPNFLSKCVSACIGDVLSFISVKDSGHWDLFVAFATFLVPSVIASLLIMGLKVRLIVRRAGERDAKLAAPKTHKANFRWLADRFILHRDQLRHDEQMSANRIALHNSYAFMLLALTEDAPFCVLNMLLLSRAFHDRFNQSFLDKQRLCSPQYGTDFTMILLILLTSVACLVYKLMHLVHLPSLWAAQKVLAAEEAQLAERGKVLETSIRNVQFKLSLLAQAPAASDSATATEREAARSPAKVSDDASVDEQAILSEERPADGPIHELALLISTWATAQPVRC